MPEMTPPLWCRATHCQKKLASPSSFASIVFICCAWMVNGEESVTLEAASRRQWLGAQRAGLSLGVPSPEEAHEPNWGTAQTAL